MTPTVMQKTINNNEENGMNAPTTKPTMRDQLIESGMTPSEANLHIAEQEATLAQRDPEIHSEEGVQAMTAYTRSIEFARYVGDVARMLITDIANGELGEDDRVPDEAVYEWADMVCPATADLPYAFTENPDSDPSHSTNIVLFVLRYALGRGWLEFDPEDPGGCLYRLTLTGQEVASERPR